MTKLRTMSLPGGCPEREPPEVDLRLLARLRLEAQ
jgi:hypothetical protein